MEADRKFAASRLIAEIAKRGPSAIAYSGGVDSAVVAAAAFRSGVPAIAIMALSPSVSAEQAETARRVAREIGIAHHTVATHEMDQAAYRANDRDRCFHCKQNLYAEIRPFVTRMGIGVIYSGTNADDLGDYRPGIEAGRAAGIVTPLADLGIGKAMVREIAKLFGLSIADRPAQPCLSSRLAYGVEVSVQRLAMVESAESFLRHRGYSPLRVRVLPGDVARIEVDRSGIQRLRAGDELSVTTTHFRELGFDGVEVDPQGFRSGSMNEVFSIKTKAAETPNDGSHAGAT